MSPDQTPVDGPWLDEPDWLQFQGPGGFVCQISRGHADCLCGYAAVPLTHPIAGKTMEQLAGIPGLRVHNSWTYADDHFPRKRSKCHWVIGFSCSGTDDYIPFLPPNIQFILERVRDAAHQPKAQYKTIAFVRAELERVCAELAVMAVPAKPEHA